MICSLGIKHAGKPSFAALEFRGLSERNGGYRWLGGSTNLLIAALRIRKHFIRKKSTIHQAPAARLTYGSDK